MRWPAVKCIRGHERSHSYIDADASAIVEENYYECTKKIDNCKDTGCPKKGQKHQVSIFSYNFFVKLRQGSGKVRQGKARKGKDGER